MIFISMKKVGADKEDKIAKQKVGTAKGSTGYSLFVPPLWWT